MDRRVSGAKVSKVSVIFVVIAQFYSTDSKMAMRNSGRGEMAD